MGESRRVMWVPRCPDCGRAGRGQAIGLTRPRRLGGPLGVELWTVEHGVRLPDHRYAACEVPNLPALVKLDQLASRTRVRPVAYHSRPY